MAWRGRVALFALFAVMLIPLGTSTLRGLSHVLICAEDVATPFTLTVEPGEEPTVTSSQTIERDAPPASGVAPTPSPSAGRLCGGLSVDLAARTLGEGRVAMHIPITNHTGFPWQGTVLFRLGGTTIPVTIGRIDPGATGTDQVEFNLGPGPHELSGELLIGP